MAGTPINCDKHGAQDFAIACIHVCRAIDSGQDVGFFWSAETIGPRPDVWCRRASAGRSIILMPPRRNGSK